MYKPGRKPDTYGLHAEENALGGVKLHTRKDPYGRFYVKADIDPLLQEVQIYRTALDSIIANGIAEDRLIAVAAFTAVDKLSAE